MAATVPAIDYAALVDLLDLPEAELVEEQVGILRERRADQLAAIAARDPEVSSASLLRLRATQRAEVELVEAALVGLGVAFEADEEGE